MKKVSKVTSIVGDGTWNTKDGMLMYKYQYEMEDGGKLSASHQSENKFAIGDEVEYEIKGTNTYGSYGSVSKPFQGGGNSFTSKVKGNNRSFALSYAKDIAIAFIEKGQAFDRDKIIETAETFNTWLDGE